MESQNKSRAADEVMTLQMHRMYIKCINLCSANTEIITGIPSAAHTRTQARVNSGEQALIPAYVNSHISDI